MMKKKARTICSVAVVAWGLLGGVAQPVWATTRHLDSFTATYDLQVGPLSVARLEYALESRQDTYRYRLTSQPKGLAALFSGGARNEEVQGRWLEDGVPQPMRYQRTDHPGTRDIVHTVAFDWPGKQLRIETDGDVDTTSLPDHTLDPMSEQLRLMQQVAAGAAGTIEHVVANLKGIKHWRFRVGRKEEIRGPQGMVQAIRVDRIDQEKKQLTLWFAPELDHMLVRLQQKKKGKPTVIITLVQMTREAKGKGS